MQFSELQTELADLHLDTSTRWAVGGTSNKLALNVAYEKIYDRYKNAERVKRKIFIQKTLVTITNKVGILPSDLSAVDRVSFFDFNVDSDMLGEWDMNDFYYNYEITGVGTVAKPYKIITNDIITQLYVSYVPVRANMSADADVPNLPPELHRSIADFGLVEYYRRIRDNANAAGALSYAQQMLNEKLASL